MNSKDGEKKWEEGGLSDTLKAQLQRRVECYGS